MVETRRSKKPKGSSAKKESKPKPKVDSVDSAKAKKDRRVVRKRSTKDSTKNPEEEDRPSKKAKTNAAEAAESLVEDGSKGGEKGGPGDVSASEGGEKEKAQEKEKSDKSESEESEEEESEEEGDASEGGEKEKAEEKEKSEKSESEESEEEGNAADGGDEDAEEKSDGSNNEDEEEVVAAAVTLRNLEKDKGEEEEPEETQRDSLTEAGGGGDEVEDEEETMALRPEGMYFPPTCYKTKIKLGTRCFVKEALETLENLKPRLTNSERRWFEEHPQFKHLFHMPKDHNHKVQGMWMLLLRTAKIEKQNEVWFIVNGVPIRYGLGEHALISGLDCRNYPLGYKERGSLDFVKRHFGKGSIRLEDVKEKLINMGPHKERLNIAVLYFLSSIVFAHTKTGKGAPNVLEVFQRAVSNLDFCKTFPWGRLSYDYMLKEIKHTVAHFNGVVKVDAQWPIPGFCLPLELLAFEAIPELGRRFREIVPGADKMCPRMCKTMFKKGDMKGFPLSRINEELGKTKDIDTILVVNEEEEKDLLAQITEEEDEDDVIDIAVESWYKRIRHGKTVFFEDMYEEDVASRATEVPTEIPAIEAPGAPVVTTQTELAEILKIIKNIEAKVNGLDERFAAVESFVEEEKERRKNVE